MHLSISFGDPTQASTESFIQTKANSAFSRFDHLLSSGEMRLRHEARTGGRLSRCSIDLKSTSNGTIHIDESDASVYVAISKAIRAAQAKLRDTSERRKSQGRKRRRGVKRSDEEFLHRAEDTADSE